MLNLFRKKSYSISDLHDQTEIFLSNLIAIRNKIKVLIIDNDEIQSGMPMVKYLKGHGFNNVDYRTILEKIEDVQAYELLLCDIRDVGHALNYNNGYDMAADIKKIYPYIGIIAFSSDIEGYDKSKVDGIFSKESTAENRNMVIDSVVRKCYSPIESWITFRNHLLAQNVSIHTVASLESYYVSKLLNKRCPSQEDIHRFIQDSAVIFNLVVQLIKVASAFCNI